MSEAELRALLTEIYELATRAGQQREAPLLFKPSVSPAEAELLIALGMIAALASVVLEGGALLPLPVELSNDEIDRLAAGEGVLVQSHRGFRLALSRSPVA